MPLKSREADAMLACPLCRGPVAAGSSDCRSCHLPMANVLRHRGPRGSGAGRAIGVRLTGLVLYAGIVAWAWYQLPQTLPFVVPVAVVGGGFLHVVRARPWLGMLVLTVILCPCRCCSVPLSGPAPSVT